MLLYATRPFGHQIHVHWEASKDTLIKPDIVKVGCGGAAQATPVLFVALAAVANHFLN